MSMLDRLIARLDEVRATSATPGAPTASMTYPPPRTSDTAPPYGTPNGGPGTPAGATFDTAGTGPQTSPVTGGGPDDATAIARYRYMLQTSSPEEMEQAHAEAFARLTPEQRRTVLDQLAQAAPASGGPISDDPRHLARAATRAEIRSPGTLERLLGGAGAGSAGGGMGRLIAGGLLASVAGGVIGSAIGAEMFGGRSGYGSGEDWADGGSRGWDGQGNGAAAGGDGGWGDGGADGWFGADGDLF